MEFWTSSLDSLYLNRYTFFELKKQQIENTIQEKSTVAR